MEPDSTHITDFASDRYYEKLLEQLQEPNQDAAQNSTPEPPQSRFILPRRPSDPGNDIILSLPLIAGTPCILEPGPNDTSFDWSRVELLPQSKSSLPESTPASVVQPTTEQSTLPLAKLFLVLPSELQIQILASLPLSDLLSLRLTSRSWHALITMNEVPIACHHLEHHIPAYAQQLYPIFDQSSPSLHYICGLWHRNRVSSKLSYLMSDWITRDIFLKETDSQQQAFASEKERMRRRLTWLLFHIFHFFEVHRALHVEYIKHRGHGLQREPYTLNPIEVQVMAMYDDDTLLRIHEVFPLLLSSLRRRLRPPAYAGRFERSLRGYMRKQPSDEVLAAILCVGGLRQVTRIWEIKGYNSRCSMVDEWYAGISKDKDQGPTRLALRRTSTKLGRRSFLHEGPARSSKTKSSLSGITIDSSEGISLEDRLVFNTSMSAGMPMGALNSEQLESLLPDLPALQQIWLRTAEALIIHRRIVKDSRGIRRNQQVMLELIREEREEDQEDGRWDERFTVEALDSSYHRTEAIAESPLKTSQTSIQSGYSSVTEASGLEFQHRKTSEQEVADQDVPRPGEREKSSLASFSRIDLWWYAFMRILDRPPSKSKRVTYRCGCGDLRYLDVEELVPGGADELQETLRTDAEAVRQHGPAQYSSPSSLPTSPPEVHLTPLGRRHIQAHDRPAQAFQSQGPSEQRTLNKSSPKRTLILPNRQKHLIVCINTKRGLVTPQHLDVSSVTNDQYLFESIKTAYSEVRREHEWNLAALFSWEVNIPSWFLKLLSITPPKHIQLPNWLANRFQKYTFFIPQKAEFVQFQLMPVRKEIYAGNLVKPEVPGYEEVAVKRTYEYRPVPLKVKIISIPFLHELLGPGEHLGLFWWNRFPKKLDGALLWDENADCLGWGIHITEGWNKPLVIVLTLFLMSSFAVFVIVYSVLTHDGSTGAGIGSFLMAFLSLYCWLRYEGWKSG